MVGRERELRGCADAFAQAVHDRSCQLFTVLGPAGVGKSRLAAEFLAGVDATRRPRPLPLLRRGDHLLAGRRGREAARRAAGGRRRRRPLRSLLGETDAADVGRGDRLGVPAAARAGGAASGRSSACSTICTGREPTLLDLVEHVADSRADAPILLLCMARPELLERRPAWGGGKWNATTVLLEPLDAAETERLLDELGGARTRAPRADRRRPPSGNPLFLEEMLALVRDEPDGDVAVPPTIQALLAARLDQLDPAERAVLERGAVEGRLFHRGAVAGARADGDGRSTQRLLGARAQGARPARHGAVLPGEDAYRFRHLLIRDAAYDALPKATRADLHGRFAAWLELHGSDLVELDEILGYHLEQAARYLASSAGPTPPLAEQASRRLAVAGERMRWRGDRAQPTPFSDVRSLSSNSRMSIWSSCLQMSQPRRCGAAPGRCAAGRCPRRRGRRRARAYACGHARLGWARASSTNSERLAVAAMPLLEARGSCRPRRFWCPSRASTTPLPIREMVQAAEKARDTSCS